MEAVLISKNDISEKMAATQFFLMWWLKNSDFEKVL